MSFFYFHQGRWQNKERDARKRKLKTQKTMTKTIGTLIREARTMRNMSLRGLAAVAQLAPSTLSQWETGKALPRIPELNAVLEALRCSEALRLEAYACIQAPRALAEFRETGCLVADDSGLERTWLPTSGDLLRALRRRKHLSLEQAAALLGVKPSTISRWEMSKSTQSEEHCDAYCHILSVEPDERKALSCLFLHPAPSEGGETRSPESLERQLEEIKQAAILGKSTLIDLRFLCLEAQLWQAIPRQPSAWDLLMQTYIWHAQWLLWRDRVAEAGEMAQRALLLTESLADPQPCWFRAVHVYATYLVEGTKRANPLRAIEFLLDWLPLARWPETEAWMHHNLATYQFRAGRIEEALATCERADQIVERSKKPMALRNSRCDSAVIHLRTGQYEKARELLVRDEQPNVYHRIYEAQTWMETMLGLGEVSAAQEWWVRTEEIVRTYNLSPRHVVPYQSQFGGELIRSDG
jgi:transcriptional regulator with XRE-family HTH domain